MYVPLLMYILPMISFLAAACISGALMGVEGHIWYGILDRIIVKTTWRNTFKKVVCDQTIAAPIYTITYIVGKAISPK